MAPPPKTPKEYSTLQIDAGVKAQMKWYVEQKGLKMNKFVESLFLAYVSGSDIVKPLP